MEYRDRARNLLRDYMKKAHQKAGIHWNDDADEEMSEIVDSIINAATHNVLRILDERRASGTVLPQEETPPRRSDKSEGGIGATSWE